MTWKFWKWFKKEEPKEVVEDMGFISPKPPEIKASARRMSPISVGMKKKRAEIKKNFSGCQSTSDRTNVVYEQDNSLANYIVLDSLLRNHSEDNSCSHGYFGSYGGGSCGGGGSSRSWDDDDDSKKCSCSYSSNDDSDYSSSYDSSSSCDCSSDYSND